MTFKRDEMSKLTAKMERFCQEYMIDLNATQAYIRVYGCSLKAAEAGSSRTLRIGKVAKRVEELKNEVQESTKVTVQSVIEMIQDTHRRAKKDGKELTAELKAADMLAKHVGAYEKDNEQQGLSITDIMAIAQGKR